MKTGYRIDKLDYKEPLPDSPKGAEKAISLYIYVQVEIASYYLLRSKKKKKSERPIGCERPSVPRELGGRD